MIEVLSYFKDQADSAVALCQEEILKRCVVIQPRCGLLKEAGWVASISGISERVVEEAKILRFLCENGGVFISNELLLLDTPTGTEDKTACALSKSGAPLPCWVNFGADRDEVTEAIRKGVADLRLAVGGEAAYVLNNVGLLGLVMSIPEVASTFSYLPYQHFAVFGIQSNARKFVLSGEDERHKMMKQVFGRIKHHKPVGVFIGRQSLQPSKNLIDAVRAKARTLALKMPPPAPPAPPAPPIRKILPTPKVEATIPEMAKSLGGSLARVVKGVVKGERVLSDDTEVARRMSICEGDENRPKCDFFDPDLGRCLKCGCFSKFKTRLLRESCPIDKW